MSGGKIWFDPTSDKWALSDGEHYLEVPHWAREIIVSEFERETRQLKAENAKLRELSGFMLRCMKRNHDCDCCLVNGEHCEISYIESDARELGVVE